eukprot:TRINITY_DN12507_c0_g1_i1.p2 TRINITY_DN12507_c0_g1~~TRINITY_DN12507_c0_g1_i1.p2  ORF type:complete len:121 (-),score=11.28 TRINITY_DN12507_c0_g1_i1:134-496(-)
MECSSQVLVMDQNHFPNIETRPTPQPKINALAQSAHQLVIGRSDGRVWSCASPSNPIQLQSNQVGGAVSVMSGFLRKKLNPSEKPRLLEQMFGRDSMGKNQGVDQLMTCLLYTSPSPRDS